MKKEIESVLEGEEYNLPLQHLLANKIIDENHIYIVKYEDSNKRIPLIFDGKRYKEDEDHFELTKIVNRLVIDVFSDKTDIDVIGKIHIKYEINENYTDSLKNAIINIILHNPNIQKDAFDFDSEDYLINTQSGVFNFQTLELYPHSSSFLLRNITNASYIDGDFEEPKLYIDFVRTSIYDNKKSPDENEEILDSLLDQYAYSMTGDTSAKYIFIGAGITGSGKSTEINLRKKMLNSYFATIPTRGLMKTKNSKDNKRPDIVAVMHARQVVAVESDEGEVLDGSLLKNLAGNDEVSFRKLYRNMIHFVPRFKVHIFSNYFPSISNLEDSAIVKRLYYITYRNAISENRCDPELSLKFQDQDMMDRIFSFLARKAHNFYKNDKKLKIHDAFLCNKEKILLSQADSISLFLSSGKVKIKSLKNPLMYQKKYSCSFIYHNIYCKYCEDLEIEPSSWTAFGKKFNAYAESFPGVKRHSGGSKMYYTGLDFPDYPTDPFVYYNKVVDVVENNCDQVISSEVTDMLRRSMEMKLMKDFMNCFN